MKKQAHSQLNHRAFSSVLFFVLLFSFGCAKEDFQPVAAIEAKSNTIAAEQVKSGADPTWLGEPSVPWPSTIKEADRRREEPYTSGEFSFGLEMDYCFAGGATVRVNIANMERYAFLWSVDGNHGGHGSSTLECICGGSAKVEVTRLADGMKAVRKISLPACANNEQ